MIAGGEKKGQTGEEHIIEAENSEERNQLTKHVVSCPACPQRLSPQQASHSKFMSGEAAAQPHFTFTIPTTKHGTFSRVN